MPEVLTRKSAPSPSAGWPDKSRNGGRLQVGMLAGFTSEPRPASRRNTRPACVGIRNQKGRGRIGEAEEDLEGSSNGCLDWLVNAPKFSAVALDEGGFPVRIEAVDPRAFALHQAWVSSLLDREPIKRLRDRERAEAVASVAVHYLNLSFDGGDLTALPRELRDQADVLLAVAAPPAEGAEGWPTWW